MFGLGPMEIVLIAGVGLLLFGSRLPEVGKGMAKGIVEFKRGLKDVESEVNTASAAKPTPPATQNQQSSTQ
jgi:sec-independent protein translocase protein TatA